MRLRFRPRLVPALATAVVAAATWKLGNWQSGRAAEKQALQEQADRLAREPAVAIGAAPVDGETLDLRRVQLAGQWVPQRGVYLDNRVRRGVAGYEIVMPLRIAGSTTHALVNRGWTAGGSVRASLPDIATPAGTVTVKGIARARYGQSLALTAQVHEGRVWQRLDLDAYRDWSGLQVQPVVVLQTDNVDDGLVREWPRHDVGVDKHLAYALQWYSFALLSVGLFAYFSFVHDAKQPG